MAESDSTSDPEAAESNTIERNTAYVTDSKKRASVLRRLVDGPAPATAIAEQQSVTYGTNRKRAGSLSTAAAESTVEQLYDRGLVERLETDDTTVYSLTVAGEQVVYALDQD